MHNLPQFSHRYYNDFSNHTQANFTQTYKSPVPAYPTSHETITKLFNLRPDGLVHGNIIYIYRVHCKA